MVLAQEKFGASMSHRVMTWEDYANVIFALPVMNILRLMNEKNSEPLLVYLSMLGNFLFQN